MWPLRTALFAASLALARLEFVNSDFDIYINEPFTLMWQAERAVDVMLEVGPSTNLRPLEVLCANCIDSAYTWTPNASLSLDNEYAFAIASALDDANGKSNELPNFSPIWTLHAARAKEPETKTNTTQTTPQAENHGLSTGAKAGIGVGCGLAVVTLLVCAGYFLYRRGKMSGSGFQTITRIIERGFEKAELSADVERQIPRELDTERPCREMDASSPYPRQKLDAESPRVEMDAEKPRLAADAKECGSDDAESWRNDELRYIQDLKQLELEQGPFEMPAEPAPTKMKPEKEAK